MVRLSVLLDNGFKRLQASDSKSLLKKYLTKEVFDQLKGKQTPSYGSSLYDCIQSGLENPDSGVGVYTPDPEAYKVFDALFNPLITDYHIGFKTTDRHPELDWGDVASLGDLDEAGKYVVSTRVRCGRSLFGYPFNPSLTKCHYKEIETKVVTTLGTFEGELAGEYLPLSGMNKEDQQRLIDDHFLFKEGDRFLESAKAHRFWPAGRGIFHNEKKNFLVWCNEEDHLRIISMQKGGHLGQTYGRLVTAVEHIGKQLCFARDERLGYLTFCPTNLGTSIRASVHIRVPKLAKKKKYLMDVAESFNLQVRGTRGEHTDAEAGLYDISNKRRLGLSEFQIITEMKNGITELIKKEMSM